MSSIDMSKLIPKSLRSDFWIDFLSAVADEISLLKSEIAVKQDYFNTRNLNDEDALQEITKTFGYYSDRSLDNSLTFLKQEINALSFKIQKKTTYLEYTYIFNSIPIIGYVYNIFYDGISLIKALDSTTVVSYLTSHDYTKPFTKIIPSYYYTSLLNTSVYLDNGLTLDSGWFLDSAIQKYSTHHLAIEVVPETLLFIINSEKYLMTLDYLNYVLRASNYTRKATEVPHVGVQLSLITDTSGFYDNLSDTTYTVDDLEANFSVTTHYIEDFRYQMFYTIVAGIGKQTMYSKHDPLGTISYLAQEIYSNRLGTLESEDVDIYHIINTYIPSGTIKNYILAYGDGSSYNFQGYLLYEQIIPLSVTLQYTTDTDVISIADDGYGVLTSNYIGATINYETGEYVFDFYKDHEITAEIVSPGSVNNISTTLENVDILLETFTITYTISSIQYIAVSDEYGNITGTGITFGTLTSGGVLLIYFSTITDHINITCNYTYRIYTSPDLGTAIYISYKTRENVKITEIGIKNYNGELISYGTIPPCYLPDSNFHTSLELIIKK